jgi:aryl-alcohol dehydrogenase (NADP+)
MEYRTLGRSGLKVSPICLGTMMFGGPTDEAAARDIVAHAREAGVNFIDTANVYTDGRSEEITGRAIHDARDHWVVATKAGNAAGSGPNDQGLSRRHLLAACEASLRRLGLDHVDIYYLHKDDPATPLDETVGALADLVRAGKVRYVGVSNFRAWRIAELCHLCEAAGIGRPLLVTDKGLAGLPITQAALCCPYWRVKLRWRW